jgi:hypothetical protein
VQTFSKRRWTLERLVRSARFENLRLVGCTFDNCGFAMTSDPAAMSQVTNVELIDCTNLNSQLSGGRLTDVRVSGLKTGDLMLVWAPLLTRVTLAGRLGSIKVNEALRLPGKGPQDEAAWATLRAAHYEQVDWALDIAAARPLLLAIDGVPAAKIKRDPETQVVVTKARLHSEAQLQKVPIEDETLRFVLESFLRGRGKDRVLVAPTGRAARFYKPVLAAFAALRRAGLVEPD